MLATLLNRILIVLAFAGLFVSGVLSAGEYFDKDIPCGTSHGCAIVAHHPSSHILVVPNAYLGFLAYLALVVLAVSREWIGVKRAQDFATIGFIIAGLGTVFSLFLTYIALTVIKATCVWCLSSLAIITATLVVHFLLNRALNAPVDSESPTDLAQPSRSTSLIVIGVSAVLAFSGIAYQVFDFSKATSGERRTLSEFSEADLAKLYAPGAHIQNPDGRLTIVEFGDLVCPQCKGMFPALSDLVQRSQGRIRYVFRHHPLYQLEEHKFALPAAAISELCAEKGKFWEFVTDCYSGDPSAPEPGLEDMLAFAKSLGVDPDVAAKRIQDENDPAFKKVLDDMNLGNHFGIHATPTFFIIAPGVKPQAIIGPKLLKLLEEPEYRAFLK